MALAAWKIQLSIDKVVKKIRELAVMDKYTRTPASIMLIVIFYFVVFLVGK